MCDCSYIINLFSNRPSAEKLESKFKLRSVEEILDSLDLYYRYHWACVDKTINPNINIGNLKPSVVIERRRGLEWLISQEDNWYNISLDT